MQASPFSERACYAQGRTYLCKKLDLSSKVAVVRPADLKYYTKTRDFTDVYVVGGKTAYQKPKVTAEYFYISAHAHKSVNSVKSDC